MQQCGAQIEVNNTEARAGIERLNYVADINIGGVVVPKEVGERIISLIESGQVVQAIKELREATGLGLKESKDAVESYRGVDINVAKTTNRFRDNILAETWYGRAFIHTYYAISPSLVNWFGDTKWFKNVCKPLLDKMITYLNVKGIKNTSYNDKKW